MGLLCNCLVGASPYTHYVIRSFPLCGVKVLPAGGGGVLIVSLRARPYRKGGGVFMPCMATVLGLSTLVSIQRRDGERRVFTGSYTKKAVCKTQLKCAPKGKIEVAKRLMFPNGIYAFLL